MKYKSFISAAMLGAALIAAPGCQDEFAETNTNQSAILEPNLKYMFTQVLMEFEPSKYQQWFYNNVQYTLPWSQSILSEGGNVPELNLMNEYENGVSQVVNVKRYVEEIDYLRSQMPENISDKYTQMRAMCEPLLVYLGMFGTDMYGSMAYSEAAKGLHEDILAPKYESQEELFKIWDKQLVDAVAILTEEDGSQEKMGSQDFIYKGDTKKWAAFANSLRLKLAVRLYHQNKAEAIRIAEEVYNSPAGVMNSLDQDFIYCKGSQEYHWGDDVLDGVGNGIASQNLINFLVDNRDPRVRFIFQKNDFNSMVVQAFLDQKKALPDYIQEAAIIKDNKFEGWKEGKGEPWVRYHGAPVKINLNKEAYYQNNYFNYDNFKLKTAQGGQKQYYPLARMNREMLQGMKDYTYPDAPDTQADQDKTDFAWYGLHFSSAEVQLYLAEMALLGANVGNANEHFKLAVELSVRSYDKLASLNHIPYYDRDNDTKFGATIELKENEVSALLADDRKDPNGAASNAYTLTGDKKADLEKVYLQQYIHFLLCPQDQFVQVRRSGVPMKNSQYLPWVEMQDGGYTIPRRWKIDAPTPSDLMHDIKMEAFEQQGFTVGEKDPVKLNTERVWYDKGAPNFGEGPKF